MQLVV
jgi:hypothetical protein